MNTALPLSLYVGIAINEGDDHCFGIYVYDGFWSYEYHQETIMGNNYEKLYQTIIDFLSQYQKDKGCKIVMAGLVNSTRDILHNMGRRLWFDLDVIPCICKTIGHDLDEKACSAARKTNNYISFIGQPGICRIRVGYRHEVEVDANSRISFCSLEDYKPFISDETWEELLCTSKLVKSKSKKIVFINSTPQGGGVAIMRHSVIRLFRLLGIEAHWFVMKPNPEVFEITKKKFHNVLQGVAPTDTNLTSKDIELYEKWCQSNMHNYWNDEDSPVNKADVIVLDDPQPSGMIPALKISNPTATIVYRSHIELRTDLMRKKHSIQSIVWKYLWNNIKNCDVFVSHPVESFIPDEIETSQMKIIMTPAVTDPCDGLNKILDHYSSEYYKMMFNRIALDQTQRKVNFARPYFIQISRFDPSKGIPDLINAYMQFRQKLKNDGHIDTFDIPQLIITGHGSIDDPEGTVIYRQIMCILNDYLENHDDLVNDITVVRLGPSDQILNAILSDAFCSFQLSHREGFEVKVSESLMKGIPVIAYKSGGIPLQVKDGKDGHLVERGNIIKVSQFMEKLYHDKDHLLYLKNNAANATREWVLTPTNIIHWNNIMLES